MTPPQVPVHPVIALTGATGTLGRRVGSALVDVGMAVRPFEGDLTELDAVAAFVSQHRPSHVIHLGAVVDLAQVDGDEARVLEVNVGGTRNLGEAILGLERPPWIFYASSSHVYAPSDAPIDEDHPTAPRNFYGLTKLLGEQVISHYAARAGAPLCIGRVFSMYDDAQTGGFLLPSTRRRIASAPAGAVIHITNGRSRRDFSHARDIAVCIVRLLSRGSAGTVNIGSGTSMTLVEMLTSRLGGPHRFAPAPGGVEDAITADITRLRKALDER